MTWSEIEEQIPKYETEVMQIGAWKSYVELEENMTLTELIELYGGIINTRVEEFKNVARANGAKIPEDSKDGVEDSEAFNRVLNQVNERRGIKQEETSSKMLGMLKINQV